MNTLPSTPIDRRTFLRGVGVTLALPWLESNFGGALHAATAAAPPRRLMCIGNHLGYWPDGFFPQGTGLDFQTSPTLQPIEAHRGDFTVFSNLDHGINGGHNAVHSFLSGIKKEESAGFAEKNVTLDQVAAGQVGSATRYASIHAGEGDGTSMCWNRAGVHIPPVNNPARLFQALFVDAQGSAKEIQRTRLNHRASVLDALNESAKQLGKRLAANDRDKLDQYLTSVREVERQLQMSQTWIDRPKPRSPIAPVIDQERLQIEEIPLFFDLLTLALQTDSTRVATFEIPLGFKTSELNVSSYHGLSHHGKEEGRLGELKVVETYLMRQFAHLMDRMKEARVFDDTLVVFGSGMGNGSTHSNRDLPVILAGGGLKHQGHIACPEVDAKRVPLSNLWLSSLQWFGVERESFGRSTGTFSPMPFV